MSDKKKKKLTPTQQEYQEFAQAREPKRPIILNCIKAFFVGGLICVIAILGGLGLYDPLVKFAGAGASVPISSFGNSLVKGALKEFDSTGPIGVLTGIFQITSAGISAAIIFAFMGALIFRPKG